MCNLHLKYKPFIKWMYRSVIDLKINAFSRYIEIYKTDQSQASIINLKINSITK